MVMELDIATYSVCLVWSYTMTCFTAFLLRSLQKLNSIGGECMFIGMFKFCLSFHSMAVKGIFHLSLYVPSFSCILSKIFGIYFLFHLTFSQQLSWYVNCHMTQEM
jgi:Na+/phosphate symporter